MTQVQKRMEYLAELLAITDATENDFVALAVAGERMRRVLVLDEVAHLQAQAMVSRYVDTTKAWKAVAPTRLDDLLEQALATLEDHASKPPHQRHEELLEDELWAIDDILCVAVASERVGALSGASDLAARAAEWSAAHTQLVCLWDLADELETLLGPDPELPEIYRWTEPLAARSERALALREASGLADERVRQRITARALEKLTASRGAQVIRLPFRRPSPVMAEAAGTHGKGDPALDAGTVVYNEHGVQIRVAEIAEGERSLVVVRVRIAPTVNADLSIEHSVKVADGDGAERHPVQVRPTTRVWWASFDGGGTFQIEVPSLDRVSVRVEIERPSK